MRMHHVAAIILLLTGLTVAAMTGVPALSATAGSACANAARRSRPPGQAAGGGGLGAKAPHLVASVWTSSSTVARTKLRHEWVDVPRRRRLRTWIEYPAGEGRAPVVLVLQHEPGLDDWMRRVCRSVGPEGFIAVAPDLFSGFGPMAATTTRLRRPTRRCGSWRAPDTRRSAAARVGRSSVRPEAAAGERRHRVLGVGTGGALSFRFAAEAPTVGAAVVFYGTGPTRTCFAASRHRSSVSTAKMTRR